MQLVGYHLSGVKNNKSIFGEVNHQHLELNMVGSTRGALTSEL